MYILSPSTLSFFPVFPVGHVGQLQTAADTVACKHDQSADMVFE